MQRNEWLKIMATGDRALLCQLWEGLSLNIDYDFMSKPTISLLPIQAKMGNVGDHFLIGDATITRTVVTTISDDKTYYGYGYILGRDKKQSELCAVIDSLLQQDQYHALLIEKIIKPLSENSDAKRKQQALEVKNTQVDFFTMVRGE